MTELSDIGIVGLGVMGGAYAMNLLSRGFRVSVWSINANEIESFNQKVRDEFKCGESENLSHFVDLCSFVRSLKMPRKILMLITAGPAVDSMLDQFVVLLDSQDIIVDCGNEWYENTNRRINRCKKFEIHFCGMGVSGGQRGARNGPCLMLGGKHENYKLLEPILKQTEPFYVGAGSSGHYVKMVHNGIEYAIMQLLSECLNILLTANKLTIDESASVFKDWNDTFSSYLLGITHMILTKKDGNDYIIEKIVGSSGSNGTGKWTVKESLDRGIPIPSIGVSVDLRSTSNLQLPLFEFTETKGSAGKCNLDDLKKVYNSCVIAIFCQGLHLLRQASKEFGWDLNIKNICRIWSKGSIISCDLLSEIVDVYDDNAQILLDCPKLKATMNDNLKSWKDIIKTTLDHNIPTPVISTTLQYTLSLKGELRHNLIQGQRDCFGMHGFMRIDMQGRHHYPWWD